MIKWINNELINEWMNTGMNLPLHRLEFFQAKPPQPVVEC